MADLCLLPSKVDQFKKDLLENKIDIRELLNPTMTSEARTAIFAKYARPEDAKTINTLFESKLILKNRILGIENFFSKLGGFGKNSPERLAQLAEAKSEYKAAQQKRIFSPTEHESFLNDLADKQAKSHVTLEQARVIDKLSNDIKVAQNSTTAKLSGVSDEYLKARNAFNNYVASLKPLSPAASIGKNLVIIARNNLLLNPSTPIKASAGQISNSIIDNITRRLAFASLKGQNSSLARLASKEAWKTFRETGNNTAAMESMDDIHVLGKGENFRTPTGNIRGTGGVERTVRTVAKISNKIAIDWEHNFTFTKVYQKAFFDMGNIISSDMAKHEGLTGKELKNRSAEIFKDAARIESQTKEGALARMIAQKQAARITSTNDTWASRLALVGKSSLNKVIPNFPLGDLLVPIAKVPANIIANGIENAGAGLPKSVIDIFQGRRKIQSSDLNTRYEGMAQFHHGLQVLMRIAGTLTVAAWLASQFKKEDFRDDKYGSHFVKIGNIWINMEYVSAISPALAGMMTAKSNKSPWGYAEGAGQSLKNLPGVSELSNAIQLGLPKYISGFFSGRGEPAFIPNLLNNRPIDRLFFGAHGVETTQEVQQDSQAAAAKAADTKAANSQKDTKPKSPTGSIRLTAPKKR